MIMEKKQSHSLELHSSSQTQAFHLQGHTIQLYQDAFGTLERGFGKGCWQCASLCTSSIQLLLNISMSQSTLFITQQCFRVL